MCTGGYRNSLVPSFTLHKRFPSKKYFVLGFMGEGHLTFYFDKNRKCFTLLLNRADDSF